MDNIHFYVTPKAEIPAQKTCYFELQYDSDGSNGVIATYRLVYHSGNDEQRIGSVKILYLIGNSYDYLPKGFDTMPDHFYSLGADVEYYIQMVNLLGKEETSHLLEALNDVATNNKFVDYFAANKDFSRFIFHDLSASQAIRLAKSIIEGRERESIYSFTYNFVPAYNTEVSTDWEVDIDFEPKAFKRSYAIIGENGNGKTLLLSNFRRDFKAKEKEKFANDQLPLFSNILTLCTSDYYHFELLDDGNPEQKNTDIDPKDVKDTCILIQERTKMIEYLSKAITVITRRGVYKFEGNKDVFVWMHYLRLLATYLDKAMAKRLFYILDGQANLKKDVIIEYIDKASSGQLQLLALITYVCAYANLNTLILIDEPEVHLHPKFVTNFFVVLNALLDSFDSYAIISTHSPIVVRECVRQNVYIMDRTQDDIPIIGLVPFCTFGENISTLYRKIFGYDERSSYFYHTIKEMAVKHNYDDSAVIDELESSGVELTLSSKSSIYYCCEELKAK